jgi:hypothetical protein
MYRITDERSRLSQVCRRSRGITSSKNRYFSPCRASRYHREPYPGPATQTIQGSCRHSSSFRQPRDRHRLPSCPLLCECAGGCPSHPRTLCAGPPDGQRDQLCLRAAYRPCSRRTRTTLRWDLRRVRLRAQPQLRAGGPRWLPLWPADPDAAKRRRTTPSPCGHSRHSPARPEPIRSSL